MLQPLVHRVADRAPGLRREAEGVERADVHVADAQLDVLIDDLAPLRHRAAGGGHQGIHVPELGVEAAVDVALVDALHPVEHGGVGAALLARPRPVAVVHVFGAVEARAEQHVVGDQPVGHLVGHVGEVG
ncbi:MAG: hypothetical protein ACK559_06775, partial [bacterium]